MILDFDGKITFSAQEIAELLTNDQEFRQVVIDYLEKKLLEQLKEKH